MRVAACFLLFVVICGAAIAQSFSDKTNAIRLDYTKPVTPTTLPVITWTVPKAEISNTVESRIVCEAEVQSDAALRSLTIEVVAQGDTLRRPLPLAGRSTYRVSQPVLLANGLNTIRLVAQNENGGKVTSSRSVYAGRDAVAEAVDANRKDYALLFATDQYEQFDELVNPVDDARTIAALLRDMYGFEVELVENPTNDEILTKITDYNTRKFNPQDQLFVFFAGHGTFDQALGEGYVVARNSTLNDRGRTSYVSHILLRSRLENIRCDHIFLMMDVCFGGTIDPVLSKSRATEDMDERADQQYLVRKLTKRTRKFLTSGSKEYVSDGIPGKHSPFAEKFIVALREVGGGTGRILSLLELQPYFMRLNSEARYGSFGSDDPASDFVFVVKRR